MTAPLTFVPHNSADGKLIEQIADRAVGLETKINGGTGRAPKLHHQMNVSACHANGNPLRLADLLAADDFNFAHDVFGIDRHICRHTGKLLNHFSPRFSACEECAA